jgi:hypothetical protein
MSNLEFLNTQPVAKKLKRFTKWQSVFVSRTNKMKGRKNG